MHLSDISVLYWLPIHEIPIIISIEEYLPLVCLLVHIVMLHISSPLHKPGEAVGSLLKERKLDYFAWQPYYPFKYSLLLNR